jgi:hypothetical protein
LGRITGLLLLGSSLLIYPIPGPLSAQERPVEVQVTPEGQLVELVLTDGSELVGRVQEAGDPFRFVLVSGLELTIPMANVRSISQASGVVEDGEYWRVDPNRTRLFFGPTGKTLPQGDGYLAVYEIFIPFIGVGISDSFLLAAGTPLIFGEGISRPFWVAPKLRVFSSERTQASVGVLAVSVEDETAGMLYGVITNGDQKNSVTAGIGYGFVEGDLADRPAIMVGGESRVGRGLKVVTENYLFPGEGGLLSVGPRFFGRKLTADLGLVVPLGVGDIVVLPLVNFVYNF